MKLNFFNLKIKIIPIFYYILSDLYYFIVLSGSLISFYIKSYSIKNFLFFLKNSSLFQIKILNDIVVIDLFAEKIRFKFVYNLQSFKYSINILINFFSHNKFLVSSVCSLFKSSNWLEREIFDMFGIQFLNHPDLRRILTDYGFQGHPLEKNFPLMGFVEIFYNFTEREIVYRPIPKSAQSFRFFNFHSN